ncbi:hypothetical protein [Nitrosopumilus sp.]|uniref:hypothetical protein n=1 Tax=Nitrosopumilus sp. TaxID=2024843 RepID=UPI002930937F|nr:hypothetical protein [Nitrosopumilus sp.]
MIGLCGKCFTSGVDVVFSEDTSEAVRYVGIIQRVDDGQLSLKGQKIGKIHSFLLFSLDCMHVLWRPVVTLLEDLSQLSLAQIYFYFYPVPVTVRS